ncbi:MAG: PhzF family phenazine biosynthesis protein [Alphaproteobacteria bacterium]|nr:PhzF family phenazine biosynthesis protein [Alphaproteobacteria bacterium]
MEILRIAAFADRGAGGNPAGVCLCNSLPPEAEMQEIAARVGYSETVFATKITNGFRARYFAPDGEVAFCGHATIALGAARGAAHGAGTFQLRLNEAEISLSATQTTGNWSARLRSPATRYCAAGVDLVERVLTLFGWSVRDLSAQESIVRANAGAEHLLIPLASRQLLADMVYDFDTGARLMRKAGLVTINFYFRDTETLIHSRNPAAGLGVYEDPATGAAAAALAGYFRDALGRDQPFTVLQGFDMGVPCRIFVQPLSGQGAPVELSGDTREISASH